MMERLYHISEKLHDISHVQTVWIFLVVNIVFWCLAALGASALAVEAVKGTLHGGQTVIFCAVGYTGFFVGFLGGAWFLANR